MNARRRDLDPHVRVAEAHLVRGAHARVLAPPAAGLGPAPAVPELEAHARGVDELVARPLAVDADVEAVRRGPLAPGVHPHVVAPGRREVDAVDQRGRAVRVVHHADGAGRAGLVVRAPPVRQRLEVDPLARVRRVDRVAVAARVLVAIRSAAAAAAHLGAAGHLGVRRAGLEAVPARPFVADLREEVLGLEDDEAVPLLELGEGTPGVHLEVEAGVAWPCVVAARVRPAGVLPAGVLETRVEGRRGVAAGVARLVVSELTRAPEEQRGGAEHRESSHGERLGPPRPLLRCGVAVLRGRRQPHCPGFTAGVPSQVSVEAFWHSPSHHWQKPLVAQLRQSVNSQASQAFGSMTVAPTPRQADAPDSRRRTESQPLLSLHQKHSRSRVHSPQAA